MTLASSSRLRVQICGALAVQRSGRSIEGYLPGRQGRLLFTYLVVNRHRQAPRDEVAEALWREPDPAAVETRLNPLLSKLRRVLGADAIHGRAALQLHLPDDWARAWGPALVALFVARRDFLPGEDAPWIDDIRHQLTLLHVRALECYA